MTKKNICVFDFETDGTDTRVCNPVQLGAVMINPITLKMIPDSEFNMGIKPPVLETDDSEAVHKYMKDHADCIRWHASLRPGMTPHKVVDEWVKNYSEKHVWQCFVDYLLKYNCNQSRKTLFSAPIAAGHNIWKFDLNIIERLSTKYGQVTKEGSSKIFYPRDKIDILHLAYYWFENQAEPKSYTMDNLRLYFGMSNENAHDALQDVRDEGAMIIRFMKLHRTVALKVKNGSHPFEGCFKNA